MFSRYRLINIRLFLETTIQEPLKAMFSVGSAQRLYNEDPRPPELMIEKRRQRVQLRISSRELSWQGRLRKDGALVELTSERELRIDSRYPKLSVDSWHLGFERVLHWWL
jgi:hypothetical protein